jgi:DNA/RNA-binding domain of Phe-tRNA-synthetase-like protein
MPLKLQVHPDIFDKFPGTALGVVVAHGINVTGEQAELMAQLCAEEARVRESLRGTMIIEHPHIAPWREAYRQFGAKPKDHPSSIENLVRRVLKGEELPPINTLVDLYNLVSLKYLLPVGGEDLDKLVGDVWLTFASAAEPAVRMLGEMEARAPKPGEVLYKDDAGAICRRWNWKEADRTKLTEATRNVFLVIERLPPVEMATVEAATRELAELVARWCGGDVRRELLVSPSQAVVLDTGQNSSLFGSSPKRVARND